MYKLLYCLFLLLIFQQTSSLHGEQNKDVSESVSLITKQNKTSKALVIISCSGKAGSSTLVESFRRLFIETWRYHYLHETQCNLILEREKTSNVIMIDSMRDIFSRKISSFFQNLHLHIDISLEEVAHWYKKEKYSLIEYLNDQFNKKILFLEQYYAFHSWKTLKYDCLKEGSFDFEKKFQFKQLGNLYFINLRFNEVRNWEEIIKSIPLPLELENFELITSNESQHKWYKDIYKDFLENFVISQADFDAILSQNAEELAHFYSPEELEAIIEKWKSHIKD